MAAGEYRVILGWCWCNTRARRCSIMRDDDEKDVIVGMVRVICWLRCCGVVLVAMLRCCVGVDDFPIVAITAAGLISVWYSGGVAWCGTEVKFGRGYDRSCAIVSWCRWYGNCLWGYDVTCVQVVMIPQSWPPGDFGCKSGWNFSWPNGSWCCSGWSLHFG